MNKPIQSGHEVTVEVKLRATFDFRSKKVTNMELEVDPVEYPNAMVQWILNEGINSLQHEVNKEVAKAKKVKGIDVGAMKPRKSLIITDTNEIQ